MGLGRLISLDNLRLLRQFETSRHFLTDIFNIELRYFRQFEILGTIC